MTKVPVEYQEYSSEAEELADLVADNRLAELSVIDNDALGGLLELVQEDVPLELAGYPALEAIRTDEDAPEPSSEAPETDEQSPVGLSSEDATVMNNFLAAASSDTFGENSPEYEVFVEKFKPSRTTDDCFTPTAVYMVIRDWACEKFDINPANVVRPFYPGGDYEKFEYTTDSVVVDNPPFSILSQIIDFYVERDIGFFLFAPSLTAMGLLRNRDRVCVVFADAKITYENGAIVNTAFVTNLCPETTIMTSPPLARAIKNADREARTERRQSKALPKYSYPPHVLTGAMCGCLSRHVSFSVPRNSGRFISSLDAQKESGAAIFGGGLLLSEKAAAEKTAAEKTAAEKAAAEKFFFE